MHELGLADAILKTVERVMAHETGELRSITVEIGDLSGVVPSFLESAWHAVRDNTPFAQVPLLMHTVPATAKCGSCGTIFVVDNQDLRCPDCKSDLLTPLSGQDLTIAQLEVYDPNAPEDDDEEEHDD